MTHDVLTCGLLIYKINFFLIYIMKEHAKIISYKQLFAKEIMLKTIFLKKEFYKMDEVMRISNFNEFITMKWFLDSDCLLIR